MERNFDFLNDLDNTPIFKFIEERGENRLHQIACMISWSQTKEGKEVVSRGGRISSRYIVEWVKTFSRCFPDQFALICSKGGKAFQEKLNNDPKYREDHYAMISTILLLWNKENPEKSKDRVEKAIQGLKNWKEENPEAYRDSLSNWSIAGASANKKNWEEIRKFTSQNNLESLHYLNPVLFTWYSSMLKTFEKARQGYKEWQKTEEYKIWIAERSIEMSTARKDHNSVFNINLKIAHSSSEAKKRSEIENVKIAGIAMARIVSCPKCGKNGAYRIMKRHHFENCYFDAVKESEIILLFDPKTVYPIEHIKKVFNEFGINEDYFQKYSVIKRLFKKFDPTKITSNKYVLINFDHNSYSLELNLEKNKIKEEIKKEQIKRAKEALKKVDKEKRTQSIIESNKRKVICPHCQREGSGSGMKSWHFDHCKNNPDRKQRKKRAES